MTATLRDVDSAELLRVAWTHGELASWLLSPCQLEIYDAIRDAEGRGEKGFVCETARRYGKSTIFDTIAIENAQRERTTQHYAAPTGKQVKNLLVPIMRQLLATCPNDMRPVWNVSDGVWTFPLHGSELHIAGCEDEAKADRLRGPASDCFFVDEAGFIPVMDYVVKDVAQPQTWTTGGMVLLGSTPPKTPAHAFIAHALRAQAEGRYIHRTIYQSTRYTPDQILSFIKEAGGANTDNWRREGLAERVIDELRAVVPEFHAHREVIVKPHRRPEFFDAYVGMDVGFDPSLTVVLFGYFDFKADLVVIEDEIPLHKMRTDVLAEAVKAKEADLWRDHFAAMRAQHPFLEELHTVYSRVSDVDDILINDLFSMHGLDFQKASKTEVDGESPLNELRIRVGQEKIRIHPRCKTLIAHLAGGIWNARRTAYEWIPGLGHLDAIDALKYFVRHVNYNRNPYPEINPIRDGWMPARHERKHRGGLTDGDVVQLRGLLAPPRPK